MALPSVEKEWIMEDNFWRKTWILLLHTKPPSGCLFLVEMRSLWNYESGGRGKVRAGDVNVGLSGKVTCRTSRLDISKTYGSNAKETQAVGPGTSKAECDLKRRSPDRQQSQLLRDKPLPQTVAGWAMCLSHRTVSGLQKRKSKHTDL